MSSKRLPDNIVPGCIHTFIVEANDSPVALQKRPFQLKLLKNYFSGFK